MTDAARGPLHDQVAIVTGGAGGIGRATCAALARAGARLVVVDINDAGIAGTEAVVAARGGEGRSLGLRLDVRCENDMEAMARAALDRFGRIDVLVASAGILRGRGAGTPKPLAKISVDEWNEVIDVNLRGTFLSNRAVLPAMIQQRSGQIVNVSSTSGQKGRPLDAAYCASKFGVVGLTESLAEEVRHHNIRVQLILPDAVDTPLWAQNGPIGAPPGMLPAERIGDLITYMLCLPADAVLQGLTVMPFRARRRSAGRGERPGVDAAGENPET